MRFRLMVSALLVIVAPAILAGAVQAQEEDNNQIEDNLSSYTGPNAEGYLGPLRDALGASLNSGLFMYAGVPQNGLHIRLDFRGMLVNFDDDDRTFHATTDAFGEETTADVPTVIGNEDAVQVSDPNGSGATYTFPGGFDIDRFGLAVPQLTVGSIAGTEAIGRYVAVETGDNEIGDIKLLGLGLRHSLSSYIELPVDLAVTGFWQKLEIGDDFIEATATTFGGQVGKHFGILGAYAGLSYDSIDMDVHYDTDLEGEEGTVDVEFEKKSTGHLTLGATLSLGILHLNGELNQASNTSIAFGFGLGN